jgi:hypothetical protein
VELLSAAGEISKHRKLETQTRSAYVNAMAKSRDAVAKEGLLGLWKDIGIVQRGGLKTQSLHAREERASNS